MVGLRADGILRSSPLSFRGNMPVRVRPACRGSRDRLSWRRSGRRAERRLRMDAITREDRPVVQVRRTHEGTSVIAAQIRGARAILGWTQPYLAARVGLAVRSIASIEAGQAIPRGGTRDRLRAVFADEGIAFRHFGSHWELAVSRGFSRSFPRWAEEPDRKEPAVPDPADRR